jgi:hypothetical protein
MIMAKFEIKNVGLRLGIRVLGTPKNAVLKLLHHTTRHNGPDTIATPYREVHDAVLRAEYNKALAFRYLKTRKLTII